MSESKEREKMHADKCPICRGIIAAKNQGRISAPVANILLGQARP